MLRWLKRLCSHSHYLFLGRPDEPLSPAPSLPPPNCPTQFKAVMLHEPTGETIVVNDGYLYIIKRMLGVKSGPMQVGQRFPGVTNVDSLYHDSRGDIVVHDGRL